MAIVEKTLPLYTVCYVKYYIKKKYIFKPPDGIFMKNLIIISSCRSIQRESKQTVNLSFRS